MRYTESTVPYNERRYGKPWMAIVNTSLTKDFEFIDWDGVPGRAGLFSFDAEPGTMLAYGQKDIRKGIGGVDGYQICMPDGRLQRIPTDVAAQYRQLSPEERWRRKANAVFAKASTEDTTENRKLTAKYSAMLGIPDPFSTTATIEPTATVTTTETIINIETEDLFTLRRNNSGSGNPRDIESLLTGSEIDRGLGYHDKRVYTGPEHLAGYWTNLALSGNITDDEILAVFPRVHRSNVALPSIAQAVELTRESFANALTSNATCG